MITPGVPEYFFRDDDVAEMDTRGGAILRNQFADALLWVWRENFNFRPFARLRRFELFVRCRVRDTVFNVKPLYNESLPSSDDTQPTYSLARARWPSISSTNDPLGDSSSFQASPLCTPRSMTDLCGYTFGAHSIVFVVLLKTHVRADVDEPNARLMARCKGALKFGAIDVIPGAASSRLAVNMTASSPRKSSATSFAAHGKCISKTAELCGSTSASSLCRSNNSPGLVT